MDELRRLINGYQVSQAIHVAATLGIADLLADGPRTNDDLAETTGSQPRALYRLLRALAAAGVLREDENRAFELSELGAQLRSDVPNSLHGWASFVGRPYHWNACAHLAESIRSGENTFRQVYGESVWEYRAKRPEESAVFDRAMSSLTGASNAAVLDAYDFGRFGTVVDVGGGNGALLAGILDRHPSVRGVLFDQPHVVANAPAFLAERGIEDRCEIAAGSFFEGLPGGGDAYVLKAIIHDREDAEAEAILRTCRRAMGEDATLLVIEQELGGPNERPPAKFSDLNMLVGRPGTDARRVRRALRRGRLRARARGPDCGAAARLRRPARPRNRGPYGTIKFAEPVSLSSTHPTDVPLPRTADRISFGLVALRARRKRHSRASCPLPQVRRAKNIAQFAEVLRDASRSTRVPELARADVPDERLLLTSM